MKEFKLLEYLSLRNVDLSQAIENGQFDPNKEYDRIQFVNVINSSNLQTYFKTKILILISMNVNMVSDIKCESLELTNCEIDNDLNIRSETIKIKNCNSSKDKEIKIFKATNIQLDGILNCKINILKADKVEALNFYKTNSLTLGHINSLILTSKNQQLIEIPTHKSLKTLILNNCHINGNFQDLRLSGLELNKCSLEADLKLPINLKLLNIDTLDTNINKELSNIKNTLEFLHLKNIDMKYFVNVYDNLKELSLIKCKISKLYNLDISPLKTLILSENSLTELPKISNSVIELNITDNKIIKINNLPSNLKRLLMAKNKLSRILKLPKNLEYFDCSFNSNLYEIPVLPESIKELHLNECNIFELDNKLPNNLAVLEISKNKLKELPKLPNTLTTLNCNYNLLTNLNNLPKKLVTLDASGNLLSKIPTLPYTLKTLDLSRNKIKGSISLDPKIPMSIDLSYNLIEHVEIVSDKIYWLNLDFNLLKEIPVIVGPNKFFSQYYTKIYLRHNRINTLKNFEYLPKFCQDHIEGNPIEKQIFKEVKAPNFEYEERVHNNMKVSIVTIPKGTVLFRGYFKEKKDIILNDFIGFPIPNSTKHRVIPYMNVFFYPYPFITERLVKKKLSLEMLSVVTTPIKMVLDILPSHNYRGDKDLNNGYTTSCDKIEWEDYKGNPFDPCFTKEFLEENPDVVGNIALAFGDVDNQKCLEGKDVELNRYSRLFSDVLNTGIPEFIMYPLRKRVMEDVVTDSKNVTEKWLVEHLTDLNYFPLYITHTREEMKETVDTLLSPEGLKHDDATFAETLHMSIDPRTKFFVIPELAEPHVLKRLVPISETDKLRLL